MSETKTILKRMMVYYLLLAINIIPSANIIPDVFPTRNVSAIYLLTLSVCLVLYYSHRVSPDGKLPVMIKSLSWMGLFMILLRGIKYSAVAEVGVLARHAWYLYYVPMLLFPLFLFCISLLVSRKENARLPKGWYGAMAVTVALIVLILTNDLHQLVFRFQPGFADWDNNYARLALFYVITAWQYVLFLTAIIILVVKCRIGNSRRNAWLVLIPFAVGIVMNVLLMTGEMPKINGSYLVEFPEALIFMSAIVLECCMQLGLIPTNTNYGRLFRQFSLSAQITDQSGAAVYSSASAAPLSAEQLALESGSRIGEHTVLNKMTLPGGYGFWQDDMSELDRLNGELAQAREELERESELIRLHNELKEKQTVIEQRTLVYDTIAERTLKQSQMISQLARKARLSSDPAIKEAFRKRIALLGAYIKRYANLTLLSQEHDHIEAGELALSFSEVLRYLNDCGIPGEIINSAGCSVPADAALLVFEAFETLIEANHQNLRGMFVNLSERDNVMLKLNLESLIEPILKDITQWLSGANITSEVQSEDDVTYICFTIPKGGEVI